MAISQFLKSQHIVPPHQISKMLDLNKIIDSNRIYRRREYNYRFYSYIIFDNIFKFVKKFQHENHIIVSVKLKVRVQTSKPIQPRIFAEKTTT